MCEKGGEIVEKKSPNYLEITPECPYLCIRFERETLLRGGKKQVLKNFEKSSKIFWRFGKMTYLCTRFEYEIRFETIRKKVLKISEKILSKRFGGFKKMTYLCTTFR